MKISEVYNSVQGEGPRVGLPTTFVRFALCNLRCPGWPCDTPHAIYPKEYSSEWQKIEVDKLIDDIIWKNGPSGNVCLTGGEPWLQSNNEMRELITHLEIAERHVECFTNGSILIPEWVFESTQLQLVIDCKLEGSGEGERAINPEIFQTNLHRAVELGQGVLKFTVASPEDLAEAMERYDAFCDAIGEKIPVYVGAVWGKVQEKDLVEWMLECGLWNWQLNVQMHKFIWPPEARGV